MAVTAQKGRSDERPYRTTRSPKRAANRADQFLGDMIRRILAWLRDWWRNGYWPVDREYSEDDDPDKEIW
jgi:hypothetical protein